MQAIGMKGETSQETEGKDKRNIHEKKEAINDVEKIVAKHEWKKREQRQIKRGGESREIHMKRTSRAQ